MVVGWFCSVFVCTFTLEQRTHDFMGSEALAHRTCIAAWLLTSLDVCLGGCTQRTRKYLNIIELEKHRPRIRGQNLSFVGHRVAMEITGGKARQGLSKALPTALNDAVGSLRCSSAVGAIKVLRAWLGRGSGNLSADELSRFATGTMEPSHWRRVKPPCPSLAVKDFTEATSTSPPFTVAAICDVILTFKE